MDLFLETPQQQAERMLRQQQRLMEMQMQGVAAQPPAQNATPAVSPAGGSAPENYSVQQDSYAQELAFDKRRTRHRRVGQRLRTISDDRAHSVRTCGDFPGLVCVHLHPQRRPAQ